MVGCAPAPRRRARRPREPWAQRLDPSGGGSPRGERLLRARHRPALRGGRHRVVHRRVRGDGRAGGRTSVAVRRRHEGGRHELRRRLPGKKVAATGFCFGGGMVWLLLTSKESRLAAAVPFYGPFPDGGSLAGTRAAVLGIYAGLDSRVNATQPAARAALRKAGLRHEVVTFPGVDHAFFNPTGHGTTRLRQPPRTGASWRGSERTSRPEPASGCPGFTHAAEPSFGSPHHHSRVEPIAVSRVRRPSLQDGYSRVRPQAPATRRRSGAVAPCVPVRRALLRALREPDGHPRHVPDPERRRLRVRDLDRRGRAVADSRSAARCRRGARDRPRAPALLAEGADRRREHAARDRLACECRGPDLPPPGARADPDVGEGSRCSSLRGLRRPRPGRAPEGRTRVVSHALAGPPSAWIVGMPLIGLVGSVDWRLAFVALPLPAAVLAGLAVAARPNDSPDTRHGGVDRAAARRPGRKALGSRRAVRELGLGRDARLQRRALQGDLRHVFGWGPASPLRSSRPRTSPGTALAGG